jgi:hypothetical protein
MAAVTLPSALTGEIGRNGSNGYLGQAYQLGPEGLKLAVPATLTFAITPAELGIFGITQLQVMTTAVGTTDHGYVLTTSTALDSGHVAAAITHFSWVWEAARPSSADGPMRSSPDARLPGRPGRSDVRDVSSEFESVSHVPMHRRCGVPGRHDEVMLLVRGRSRLPFQ